jgi:hypothetical protein
VEIEMSKFDITDKAGYKEYKNCSLRYRIEAENAYDEDFNLRNLDTMIKALDAVGIQMSVDLDSGILNISIDPERYITKQTRCAGRRKKFTWNREQLEKCIFESYKYSDIVLMMQTMKDKDIADEIGMPIATYYRHKKTLKESNYYARLDLNRLHDKEYLESVSGNFSF